MFQVLLADDESRILKFLQTEIPWEQLGLEVIACASDGCEAARLAAEHQIDIAITDIRMPSLNGLELCKRLYEINPNTQIIIMSGFADFSYAQEAIRMKVLGYLLKPIDTLETIRLLKDATRNIQKENSVDTDSLLDCIEDGSPAEIESMLSKMGVGQKPYFVAASVGLPNQQSGLGSQFSVKIGKRKYLYLSSRPMTRQIIAENINRETEKVGAGIYPIAVLPEQLNDAISDSIIMAYQFFITDKSTLCEMITSDSCADTLFKRLKKEVEQTDSLKLLLEELKISDCSSLLNIRSAFRFYNDVYSSKPMGIVNDLGERYLYGYEQLATDYGSFPEVLDEMISALSFTTFEPVRESPSMSFLQIIKYVNDNFEKELSLKKISQQFNMNSSYISQLIKNETGLTYSQYLTELRIGKAKQLLATSQLSLSQICEAVGFNDYFYFIKKFKKIVGVTPGRYLR